MFHSALPPLLSVSTVCSITGPACRYLAFPQPQAAPVCCISLSSTSGQCSAIIFPHLPCVQHSHAVPTNEPSSASVALRISLSWSSLLLCPFQQLLQLSSNISPVLLPISHLFAVSYVLSNLLGDFLSGVDLRNCCSSWLLSSLPHLCITLPVQTLDLTSICCRRITTVQPDLKDLAILFTVPRLSIVTFWRWGPGTLTGSSRVPKQVYQLPRNTYCSKVRIMSQFSMRLSHLCVLQGELWLRISWPQKEGPVVSSFSLRSPLDSSWSPRLSHQGKMQHLRALELLPNSSCGADIILRTL